MTVELMTTLAERLRKADEMIESLAFLGVGERFIRTFLGTASGSGKNVSGFLQTEKLTHKELAARIGSSREAASTCMKVLSAKGIIKEAERHILIARDALERLRKEKRTEFSSGYVPTVAVILSAVPFLAYAVMNRRGSLPARGRGADGN